MTESLICPKCKRYIKYAGQDPNVLMCICKDTSVHVKRIKPGEYDKYIESSKYPGFVPMNFGDDVKTENQPHYTQFKIQPMEFIGKNELGFMEGNIIKYVCRYKQKGGVEDLVKARHYLEKLIELRHEGTITL